MNSDGSVLVICTGNVCRSPYIEARLRHALKDTQIHVSSAGTHALVGSDMDPGTRGLLVRAGIPGDAFAARQLTSELIASADLVIAAALEHRSAAARLNPRSLGKILTLRDLADLLMDADFRQVEAVSNEARVRKVLALAIARRSVVGARQADVDLIDPIGGTATDFEQMAAAVDSALSPIIAALGRSTA